MPVRKEALFVIKHAVNKFDILKTRQEVCPGADLDYLNELVDAWDEFYYRLMYNYSSIVDKPQ